MWNNRRRNRGTGSSILNGLETRDSIPLTMIDNGRKVRLIGVDGGRGLQMRLAEMGLTPGAEIEVISNTYHGPFIVAVKGSRVILGRGMATKISVK